MINKTDLLELRSKKIEENKKNNKANWVKNTLENIDVQLQYEYEYHPYEWDKENPGRPVSVGGYGSSILIRKEIPALQEEINVVMGELKRAGYESEIRFNIMIKEGKEVESPTDTAYLFIKLD